MQLYVSGTEFVEKFKTYFKKWTKYRKQEEMGFVVIYQIIKTWNDELKGHEKLTLKLK